MIVGVGLDGRLGLSAAELLSVGRTAAALGFESLWTPRRTMPDAFHICSRWALEAGPAVRVGIAVIPAPQMWHPATLAAQAATVSFLSGGRFVLGLGTGGYGSDFWESLGLPPRPIAIMREYVGAVRAALTGAPFRGEILQPLHFELDQPAPAVPIYLAALGPQMIRLAGRVADGVFLNNMTTEGLAEATDLIVAGATAAGRTRGDVSIASYVRCCVDDDVDAARRVIAKEVIGKIRPTMRRSHSNPSLGYPGQLSRLGFKDEVEYVARRLSSGVQPSRLLDDIPPELCASVAYYGPAAGAAAGVARLASGLDELVVRIAPARPGQAPLLETLLAVTPARVRAAAAALS